MSQRYGTDWKDTDLLSIIYDAYDNILMQESILKQLYLKLIISQNFLNNPFIISYEMILKKRKKK